MKLFTNRAPVESHSRLPDGSEGCRNRGPMANGPLTANHYPLKACGGHKRHDGANLHHGGRGASRAPHESFCFCNTLVAAGIRSSNPPQSVHARCFDRSISAAGTRNLGSSQPGQPPNRGRGCLVQRTKGRASVHRLNRGDGLASPQLRLGSSPCRPNGARSEGGP